MKEYIKNLLLAVLIFPILYLMTITISFMFSRFLPGDPVLAYLPEGTFSQAQYEQIRASLGLNDPLILQFFRYSFNMFIGNWGQSQSIARGMPVLELFALTTPRTIDLLIIPLIVSLLLGYYIGKFSLKRTSSTNRVIQISSLIVLAMPIVIIGMGFQLIFRNGIFPVIGYKGIGVDDPPFITGFRIIDSMLSGQWNLIADYLFHLILPCITLTIVLLPLIIFLTRAYLLNKKSRPSLLFKYPLGSILSTITIGFGMIISFASLVEIVFGFNGFGQIFINSISNSDYWVFNAYIYIFPLIFAILVSGSLLLLALYGYIKGDPIMNSQTNEFKSEEKNTTIQEDKSQNPRFKNFKADLNNLGKYLLMKLRSPYTIIGLGIIVFAIIVSFFPNLLTPYSYNDALGVFTNAWQPPSPDHPLGTTKFGRDVLARIIYGVPVSLIPVLISVGDGLLGGLIIGIPLNLLKNRHKTSLNGLMIPLFIYPVMLAGIFGTLFFGSLIFTGPQIWFFDMTYGLILIPIFSMIITKADFNMVSILKQLIPYIPLIIGFIFLINSYAGFLGFYDYRLIQFGGEISSGRLYLDLAPWATFYPGLAIFILGLGFFLLYAGLRQTPEEELEIQRNF